jgi:hypothetical protein
MFIELLEGFKRGERRNKKLIFAVIHDIPREKFLVDQDS